MRSPLLGFLLGLGPGAALGVGRFAYALVLPAMQADLLLSFGQAGLIGSANTAGYLLGALISHRVLYRTGYRRGFYGALLLQALTLVLLFGAAGLPVLMLLRFLQGVLGAFVFVGGAALLLASGGSSLAIGLYYGGVGVGILLSPLAVLLATTWQLAWVLLAALAVLLLLVSLQAWPHLGEPAPRVLGEAGGLKRIAPELLAYGLYGAGYIGYMTFVTTGLRVPLTPFWMLLGLGASLTGIAWGPVIGRFGGRVGLLVVLCALAGSSLYPLVTTLPWLSAFVFGISFLGVITAITVVFRAELPAGEWARAMALSTAAFALGQALGPSLSGLAGDLVGGAVGAIGLSTLLLLSAVAVAGWRLVVRRTVAA